MTKHTRGSWWHGGAGCCVKRRETEGDHGEILPERHIACTWGEDANGWKPDIYSREDEANAARIVACVNALEGIDDPEAEIALLRAIKAGAVALVRAVFENGDSVPLAQDLAGLISAEVGA
jgi:hypothetical protein